MEAILKFNMDISRDVHEFNMVSRSREYLDTIFIIGTQLKRLLEDGGDIKEAVDMYNEVVKSLGIYSLSDQADEHDN